MERMSNEHIIYNVALYCRLSKDDEQAGESVSIGTQKLILEKFCKEHDFHVFDVYVDDGFSDFGSGIGITANYLAEHNDVTVIEPDEDSVKERWADNDYENCNFKSICTMDRGVFLQH